MPQMQVRFPLPALATASRGRHADLLDEAHADVAAMRKDLVAIRTILGLPPDRPVLELVRDGDDA